MKTLRLLMLVLIAALLPVRGALSTTLLCGEAGGQEHTHAAAGAVPAQGEVHLHAGAQHPHGDDTGTQLASDPPSHEDAAELAHHLACASVCHATPLVSALPAVSEAPLAYLVAVPVPTALVPSFESGGPDRPPRSS